MKYSLPILIMFKKRKQESEEEDEDDDEEEDEDALGSRGNRPKGAFSFVFDLMSGIL